MQAPDNVFLARYSSFGGSTRIARTRYGGGGGGLGITFFVRAV
jgi:hypothetical protein